MKGKGTRRTIPLRTTGAPDLGGKGIRVIEENQQMEITVFTQKKKHGEKGWEKNRSDMWDGAS